MGRFMGNFYRTGAVVAALGFIAFFIWIVTIADAGNGTPWWSGIISRIPYGDKVGHLCLVSLLSFLCHLAFPSRKRSGVTLTTLMLLTILTLEELSQGWISTRTLDVFDWLADLAGLVVGQFCGTRAGEFIKSRVIELKRKKCDDPASEPAGG